MTARLGGKIVERRVGAHGSSVRQVFKFHETIKSHLVDAARLLSDQRINFFDLTGIFYQHLLDDVKQTFPYI